MYKPSLLLFFCIILSNLSFGQRKKKANYTFSRPETIVIDANILDWHDQLSEVANDFWAFGVAEQNNHLIVAVIIKDQQLLREAFSGGLFVDVSYDGRKKEGARFQFPYWDRERKRALANNEDFGNKNIEQELLNSVNGYFLTGFGRVRDGVLALENDYGIEAKARIDSNKSLVYEARIPIELIGLKSDQISVNLGINTQYSLFKKAASNSNRNTNMYPMMRRPMVRGTIKNPYAGETEVWVFDKIKK